MSDQEIGELLLRRVKLCANAAAAQAEIVEADLGRRPQRQEQERLVVFFLLIANRRAKRHGSPSRLR